MKRRRFKAHNFKQIGKSMQTDHGSHWRLVVPYPSHGRRYYRFMAGLGDTIEICRHIPGGVCGSPQAEARASEVGRWIRLGRSPEEILGLINSWGGRRRK